MLKVGDWVRINCTCTQEDCRKHRKAKTLFRIYGMPTEECYTLANADGSIALGGGGYVAHDLIPENFLAAARDAIQAAGMPSAPDAALVREADADSK